jgi:hypothetical protein
MFQKKSYILINLLYLARTEVKKKSAREENGLEQRRNLVRRKQ